MNQRTCTFEGQTTVRLSHDTHEQKRRRSMKWPTRTDDLDPLGVSQYNLVVRRCMGKAKKGKRCG